MQIFLYGTLRHLPLLAIVLGKDPQRLHVNKGVLHDHIALQAKDGDYPILTARKGAQIEGHVISLFGAEALARIAFYEELFEYHKIRVFLDGYTNNQEVFAFVPKKSIPTDNTGWSLERFVTNESAFRCVFAHEAMRYYDHLPHEQIHSRMHVLQTRAAQKYNAQINPPKVPQSKARGIVEELAWSQPYAKFYAIEEYTLRVPKLDHASSAILDRAVFAGTDASIVLLYDPVLDAVGLVEQFRPGPFARGDMNYWPLEPVAGRIDPGETARAAAYREAKEEAGVTLLDLIEVTQCYPSPGASSEFFHLFIGLCDLASRHGTLGGLEDEQEDIRITVLPYEIFLERLTRGAFGALPTITLGYYLSLNRENLLRRQL